MWGTVILIFVALWLLQIILTYFQSKHYKETIRAMSRQSSGYLGVGVAKQKLGVGSVMILVCDRSGIIVQAKELTGVTVFSRFKSAAEFIGQSIEACSSLNGERESNRSKAISMAIQNIRKEMDKKKEGYVTSL